MPGPIEANHKEPLLPWNDPANSRIILGATIKDACASPQHLEQTLDMFKTKPYALTYRQDTKKVYVLLKEKIKMSDVLLAALDAHTVLCMVDRKFYVRTSSGVGLDGDGGKHGGGTASISKDSSSAIAARKTVAKFQKAAHSFYSTASPSSNASTDVESRKNRVQGSNTEEIVRFVAANGKDLQHCFATQATEGGWKLALTMLNPTETRIRVNT